MLHHAGRRGLKGTPGWVSSFCLVLVALGTCCLVLTAGHLLPSSSCRAECVMQILHGSGGAGAPQWGGTR